MFLLMCGVMELRASKKEKMVAPDCSLANALPVPANGTQSHTRTMTTRRTKLCAMISTCIRSFGGEKISIREAKRKLQRLSRLRYPCDPKLAHIA